MEASWAGQEPSGEERLQGKERIVVLDCENRDLIIACHLLMNK